MRRGLLVRVIPGFALPLIWLIAGSGLAPAAQAELGPCYSDPVVVLSDGTTLDLNDTIGDSYQDVQQIAYTVHAPAGVSIVSVTYTSGPIGPKESLQFVSSGSSGQYEVSSTVTTGSSSVPVTAAADAVDLDGASGDSGNGWNGQEIQLTLST